MKKFLIEYQKLTRIFCFLRMICHSIFASITRGTSAKKQINVYNGFIFKKIAKILLKSTKKIRINTRIVIPINGSSFLMFIVNTLIKKSIYCFLISKCDCVKGLTILSLISKTLFNFSFNKI